MAGIITIKEPLTPATQTVAVAEVLSKECTKLLEPYKQMESFTTAMSNGRLVSVPHPSVQPDAKGKLRSLHVALLQCRSLMEQAIAKEEKEFGSEKNSDYRAQRLMVKIRLSHLVNRTGELLKSVGGATVDSSSLDDLELDGISAFDLKVWVFRVFSEINFWAMTTITTVLNLYVPPTRSRSNWNR